ncbi:hypothetical protein XFF6992_270043 [Xanthomonas citri pv. fuscans]|nr:hypothetical protein XFF6992_270043 [Xanthomonas citri pv. fuscans]
MHFCQHKAFLRIHIRMREATTRLSDLNQLLLSQKFFARST